MKTKEGQILRLLVNLIWTVNYKLRAFEYDDQYHLPVTRFNSFVLLVLKRIKINEIDSQTLFCSHTQLTLEVITSELT